jgi:sugar O-acyltransferase (sialic acid O-acetyltransferase NeuD family)
MSDTNIIIVGAGGFGRELCAWVEDMIAQGASWRLAGFLDGNPHSLDGYSVDYPLLGDPANYVPHSGEQLICAIGTPAAKRQVVSDLFERGATFATLIHPTAYVGPRCQVGQGVVVCPRVVVTCDVKLGDFAMLNVGATVGHDATIGPWSTLSGHVDITGYATLGEGVFAGSHAVVLPGVTVGNGAIIAAGSVAMRNVPPGQTVVGVPAKKLPTLERGAA